MGMVIWGVSMGSGESAMMWASRWARDSRSVSPSGVNPP